MSAKGWIGVDLDGTLAFYDRWRGERHVGPPVPAMLARVKKWLADGWEVRIVTARAEDPEAVTAIDRWCEEHVGLRLRVTREKDYQMLELWDDRAVQVEKNTGRRVDGKETAGDAT